MFITEETGCWTFCMNVLASSRFLPVHLIGIPVTDC